MNNLLHRIFQRRWALPFLVCTLAWLASPLTLAGDDDDEEHEHESRPFVIKKVEWRAEDRELRIEGEGENGLQVTAVNALDPGQLLGTREIREGKWKLRLGNPAPSPVPCRVRVTQSDGEVMEKAVKEAPSNCAPREDDHDWHQFKLKKAEWRHEDGELRVEGEGRDGLEVTVRNAYDPAQVLGVRRVDDDKWKLRLRNPAPDPVPCRVRAEQSDGLVLERDVKDAPKNCAPRAPVGGNLPPRCQVDEPAADLTIGVGDHVVFAATATDADGHITSVAWSFPGGSPASAGVEDPGAVTYGAAGTFTARFSATDNDGASCRTTRIITVQAGQVDKPPVCSIDSPTAIVTTIDEGGSVNFTASVLDEAPGSLVFHWDFGGGAPDATVEDPGPVVFDSQGIYTVSFTATDAGGQRCTSQVRTIEVRAGGDLQPPVSEESNGGLLGIDRPGHVVLGANDLGMHCADQDDRIFSILPPFNVLHSQVIERGIAGRLPRILDDTEVSVVYSAASNPDDPAGAGSINSTSANFPLAGGTPRVYKGNFWDKDPASGHPIGYDVYAPLFFGLLDPAVLTRDLGLPAPETALLTGCLPPPFASGSGDCGFEQQAMPGIADPYYSNEPQPLHFDGEVGFFEDLLGGVTGVDGQPLGRRILKANWFRADGIPMLPVDDQGLSNAYPLVRVQALKNGTPVASTDVVLPVASEADCQGCHLDPNQLCTGLGLTCEGQAASFAGHDFQVVDLDDPETLAAIQGDTDEQKVLNAAKINILRLHDTKHGTSLDTTLDDPASNPRVVCASCHYSPALDLAQVGPTDTADGTAGPGLPGTEQSQHISMSRAMHGHHGSLTFGGSKLFPDMPPPDGRDLLQAQSILEETCYQCHPGKRTKCLRGAMGGAGIVCQDCHGSMEQVGNDFTVDFPNNPGHADFARRVPWASEPKCQSCHTGDANNPNHPAGSIVAPDGIRLLQAYVRSEHADQGGDATPIVSLASRFAENQTLYRLSGNDDGSGKGHGGMMCEGCHGSPHAIWPNANPFSNDNVAAKQLQGHSGTLMECTTCHDDNSLDDLIENGQALEGPHGMHPVNSPKWIKGDGIWHGKVAEQENRKPDGGACKACHGPDHRGTVLSRTPVARELRDEDGKVRARVEAGEVIGCGLCHDLKKSFGD